MTPKEKAQELIEKFSVHEFNEIKGWFRNDKESKAIAIDVCNEVLSANPESFHYDPSQEWQKDFLSFPDNTHVDAIKYWQKVKEEINNTQ